MVAPKRENEIGDGKKGDSESQHRIAANAVREHTNRISHAYTAFITTMTVKFILVPFGLPQYSLHRGMAVGGCSEVRVGSSSVVPTSGVMSPPGTKQEDIAVQQVVGS
jgi:hypothetical protein